MGTQQSHENRPEGAEHTPEQLREYLDCWRRPGGTLAPSQTRALIDWSETPEEEKRSLEQSLEGMQQQVPARSLAPNQRRGHVGWLDRIKGLFRP